MSVTPAASPSRDMRHTIRAMRPSTSAPAPASSSTRQSEVQPTSRLDCEGVRRRFRHLFDEWDRETCFYSFPHQVYQHRAYKEILSLGEPAIPYMLGEIQRGHRSIVAALRAISGESPVRASNPTTDKIAAAWMEWGAAKGYVPVMAISESAQT